MMSGVGSVSRIDGLERGRRWYVSRAWANAYGSLSRADRPVVAAEVSQTVYPFVSLLRQMQEVRGRLVTVDDADTVWGRVAVVLGLHNLLADPGHGGDYGSKASTLIPSRQP